jgi:hypothetical protein
METALGSRITSLQYLALSYHTHRPNVHDACPPAIPFRIAGPRALGASAETMEVGIHQGCPPRAAVDCATRLRYGGPFGLSLTETSFCCPSFSLAVYPSLLQSILLSCSPSFSYAVHPIFCSCEELLHPLTIVGLRLLRPFPLRA